MRTPTVLRYISILYRYSRIHLGRRLRGLKAGPGQYPFLLAALRLPGISQDQLAEELAFDKGTTARAVGALERAGYLQRVVDPRDRRMHHLYVTDPGRAYVDVLDKELRAWTDVLFRGLSVQERDQAFELIFRMSENARDFLALVKASSRP
ncbi:MAG: MarR family transcriptional regulator [Treponema sp.]|nr:MarR family transcriptional regulator [Treponema sp.]